MAYNITTTAGAAITTVADGTVNSSATSLTLIGKNYAGYGIFLNENYVGLLEHFAATTAPTAPLTGQLWYDSANQVLKVYNGSAWKPLSTSNSTSSTPSTAITGDLWWDTTNSQLKAYSGTEWVVQQVILLLNSISQVSWLQLLVKTLHLLHKHLFQDSQQLYQV
jgi:hypothetical protein